MTTKNQTDSDGTGKKETPASRARGRGFFFCLCRSGRAFAARPLRSEFVADGSAIGARLAWLARDAARLPDRREDRRQILGLELGRASYRERMLPYVMNAGVD